MLKFYRIISYLLAPFLRLFFYLRCYKGKDRIDDVVNHFGVATIARPSGRLLWVHAASVGESMSALTYIKHILSRHDDLHVLLTTVTVTSADILRSQKIPRCMHQFVVADNPIWVRRFLEYWRPDKAIFLESEIWINILEALRSRNVPTYLLNARLSDRSFARWQIVADSFGEILKNFTLILAQSQEDAERFRFFSPHNVEQIDNLKYANEPLACNNELKQKLEHFCKGKKVFVAASTHAGEEEIILAVHKALSAEYPIITILVPRHIDRIPTIIPLMDGINYGLRSKIDQIVDPVDFLLIDSFGELGTIYRLADVVFVGGSMVPIGGHNIYEPAILGKPVLHGIHMENFRDTVKLLRSENMAFEVVSILDIYDKCCEIFQDENIQKRAACLSQRNPLAQIDRHIIIRE